MEPASKALLELIPPGQSKRSSKVFEKSPEERELGLF
jgi:hypothetical protein